MISRPMLLALRRVPLSVLAHQLRRRLRDGLVPLAPRIYRRWIDRRTRAFPGLMRPMAVPVALAEFIGRYYRVDRAACRDASQGIFDLMGSKVDFGRPDQIDWRHRLLSESDHHLWRMKLCQIEVVHSLLVSNTHSDRHTIFSLLDSFDRATGFDVKDAFRTIWAPYGASHRILALLSGLVLADAYGRCDAGVWTRVSDFLRRDAAFLRANVEHDLRNNHTERNLAALCLYGMACGGYETGEAKRLDREVHAIITQTILPDGMQIERSAMYQGLSVMALRIFAAADFLDQDTRRLAAERGASAERAWRMLSHRDGEIALFNDSWMDEVPPVQSILGDDEEVRGGSTLVDAGYARLTCGEIDVWMDAGAIGPDWNPGHGHADFLSVEVDVAGERLLVDPGTSQYSTGSRRAFERSAASHNGPAFNGIEPVDYIGCFKVGRLVEATMMPSEALTGLPEDAIGGSLSWDGRSVRRIVIPASHGEILIADVWSARERTGRSRFLIPVEWALTISNPTRLSFRKGNVEVRFEVMEGSLNPAGQDQWSRRYREPEPAHIVDVTAVQREGGQSAIMRICRGEPEDEMRVDLLRSLRAGTWEGL